MPFDGTTYRQDPVLSVLLSAREIVARPGGWHQGWITNGKGGYCARGALWEAMIERMNADQASWGSNCVRLDRLADYELFAALPLRWRLFGSAVMLLKRNPFTLKAWSGLSNKCTAVEQYNDWPLRKQAEIVALFHRAESRREAELQTGGRA